MWLIDTILYYLSSNEENKEENKEENEAAEMIQKFVKQKLVIIEENRNKRKEFLQKQICALKIQKCWLGYIKMKKRLAMRKENRNKKFFSIKK